MRFLDCLEVFLFLFVTVHARPAWSTQNGTISTSLFESLEELARIVDISYCVGSTGIQEPFVCLSRCKEFPGFELVTSWNTGPLLSDSCGYIAISHEPFEKRVIVAFRGTYSIANTIADLSTRHAVYAPYPSNDSSDSICSEGISPSNRHAILPQLLEKRSKRTVDEPRCGNCTIHAGFLTSWQNTRCIILPHIKKALAQHPDYKLVLVGHSLGGAVAAIAGLELDALGYNPHITTFGEPRIGNRALNQYIDRQFDLTGTSPEDSRFRRVTHVDDPIPLLPLEEWEYEMHAGEIYISKSALPPGREDLRACSGDEDPECIQGGSAVAELHEPVENGGWQDIVRVSRWGVPSRYKLWQLFFAHRDYFWRLGLCMPGGDPWDWNRGRSSEIENGHDDEL